MVRQAAKVNPKAIIWEDPVTGTQLVRVKGFRNPKWIFKSCADFMDSERVLSIHKRFEEWRETCRDDYHH